MQSTPPSSALEGRATGRHARGQRLCETRAFVEQQRCPESTLKCELRQTFARSMDPVGVHALACCPSLPLRSRRLPGSASLRLAVPLRCHPRSRAGMASVLRTVSRRYPGDCITGIPARPRPVVNAYTAGRRIYYFSAHMRRDAAFTILTLKAHSGIGVGMRCRSAAFQGGATGTRSG